MSPEAEVKVIDLYPDLGEEIDRRIRASEYRIKYWVIAGVMTQALVLATVMVPSVFYLGQISRDVAASTAQMNIQAGQIKELSQRMDDRYRQRQVWEMSMQSWAQTKGYQPFPIGTP